MKETEDFAIIHELEDTQFLAHRWYEPDDDTFKLLYKFWCEKINGFISATLTWQEDKETDHNAMFDKFRDIEYCKKFKLGTEAKFFGD
jgi:hypothetical protein